jgi:hypothetical protein
VRAGDDEEPRPRADWKGTEEVDQPRDRTATHEQCETEKAKNRAAPSKVGSLKTDARPSKHGHHTMPVARGLIEQQSSLNRYERIGLRSRGAALGTLDELRARTLDLLPHRQHLESGAAVHRSRALNDAPDRDVIELVGLDLLATDSEAGPHRALDDGGLHIGEILRFHALVIRLRITTMW